MAETKKIRITLAKGIARARQDHRDTVRGLGLKWTNHTVEIVDTSARLVAAQEKAPGVIENSQPGALRCR